MKVYSITLSVLLLCILFNANAIAEVYKKTNPDGSVTFSDVPDKINAEPIELPPTSTYAPPAIPAKPLIQPIPVKKQPKYKSVSITSPANDEAVRNNAGNLTIQVSVNPALRSGHKVTLLMDGNSVGTGTSGKFELKNVDRGSHTFVSQIIDEKQKMVIESEAVVVHLLRAIVRP